MKKLTHTKIINEILENVRDDMDDEEIIHLVLEKTVSLPDKSSTTKGQKLADIIAKIAGSWTFIIIFVILLATWMIFNLIFKNSIDPYPFILLNLILSCVAAIQASIIMMSQNRQEQKDRLRNEVTLAYGVYSQLAQQLEMARIKVQEQTPCVTVIEPAGVPTQKSNTSKAVILIAFVFLGVVIASGYILVKDMFFKKDTTNISDKKSDTQVA